MAIRSLQRFNSFRKHLRSIRRMGFDGFPQLRFYGKPELRIIAKRADGKLDETLGVGIHVCKVSIETNRHGKVEILQEKGERDALRDRVKKRGLLPGSGVDI